MSRASNRSKPYQCCGQRSKKVKISAHIVILPYLANSIELHILDEIFFILINVITKPFDAMTEIYRSAPCVINLSQDLSSKYHKFITESTKSITDLLQDQAEGLLRYHRGITEVILHITKLLQTAPHCSTKLCDYFA